MLGKLLSMLRGEPRSMGSVEVRPNRTVSARPLSRTRSRDKHVVVLTRTHATNPKSNQMSS